MENNTENPPTFPDLDTRIVGEGMTETIRQSGMTLRDYLAAKAMEAMLTSPDLMEIVTGQEIHDNSAL